MRQGGEQEPRGGQNHLLHDENAVDIKREEVSKRILEVQSTTAYRTTDPLDLNFIGRSES